MIDLTDRHTLMTIQAALQAAKLALLQKDHADMSALFVDIEQRLQR